MDKRNHFSNWSSWLLNYTILTIERRAYPVDNHSRWTAGRIWVYLGRAIWQYRTRARIISLPITAERVEVIWRLKSRDWGQWISKSYMYRPQNWQEKSYCKELQNSQEESGESEEQDQSRNREIEIVVKNDEPNSEYTYRVLTYQYLGERLSDQWLRISRCPVWWRENMPSEEGNW